LRIGVLIIIRLLCDLSEPFVNTISLIADLSRHLAHWHRKLIIIFILPSHGGQKAKLT